MRAFAWLNSRRLGVAAIVIATLACLVQSFDIYEVNHYGNLTGDTDSQMRLAFLSWDLVVRHSILATVNLPMLGAPFGASIHWTLPCDLAIFAIAAPLALFEPWLRAMEQAGWVYSPLFIIGYALAAIHLARSIGIPRLAPWTVLVFLSAPAVMVYGGLLSLSHHLPAILFSLMAISSTLRLARNPRGTAGLAAAAWTLLAVWESMETLPISLFCWVVALAAAAWGNRPTRVFVDYALASAVLPALALLVDTSSHGFFDPAADRLSVIHLAMFAAEAMLVLAARAIRRRVAVWPSQIASGVMFCAAMGPLCVWWAIRAHALFPDPMVNQLFWNNIAELESASNDAVSFPLLWLPAGLAVPFLLWRAFTHRRRPQGLACLAWCVVLLGLLTAASIHIRVACYVVVIAVLPAALFGYGLSRRLMGPSAPNVVALGLATTFLGISVAQGIEQSGRTYDLPCHEHQQQMDVIASLLPPGSVILADGSAGPDLMVGAGMYAYGAGYHRDISGLHDAVSALYVDTIPVAAERMLRRHTAAVAFCSASAASSDTLGFDIMMGHPPSWLQFVPGASEHGVQFFLVDQAGLRAAAAAARSQPH